MLGLVAPHEHGEERRLQLPPAGYGHPEHGRLTSRKKRPVIGEKASA